VRLLAGWLVLIWTAVAFGLIVVGGALWLAGRLLP